MKEQVTPGIYQSLASLYFFSITSIPIVDISPFLDEEVSQEMMNQVVEAMREACTTCGFFYLLGHGIFEEDCKSAMGKSFRGYEPPALQMHQEGLLPDTKEGFILGCEIPADAPEAGTFHTGPNQWPESIPMMEYHSKMIEMVKVVVKILALGLPDQWNCSPDVFDEMTHNPSAPLRLLHYASQPLKCENQYGVGDHTDFGNVSVLLQEEGRDGLEAFYPPTHVWVPVPALEHSYVINIGNMMQKWTGGYYKSARHRVINHKTKSQYITPFSMNGNLGLKCRALDGSGTETVIGDHIRQRLVETIGGEAGKKLGY
ncbi:hypothetical protein GQ44DRAFT_744621 [Phaeosphaeriaceae sp. PMI808]|nr:hypothetical protein GQ44DRAFT_744621 [Phaeosphaeriaceae sp. PMI808]